MTNKNSKKGFTIIEVVLVLAIAGLIFLMVFIALPALQRSQRNTRRRQDMSRILSAFNDYMTNNSKMPDGIDQINDLIKKYITAGEKDASGNVQTNSSTVCAGEQFCDPDGTPYHFASPYGAYGGSHASPTKGSKYNYNSSTTEVETQHAIYYWSKTKCADEEGKFIYTGNSKEISIFYQLEGGAIYCGDNQ